MPELNKTQILFIAENSLLAWTRTSIALMTFGFVVERFGLFLVMTVKDKAMLVQWHFSFVVGELLVIFAALTAFYSVWQHKRFLKTLMPDADLVAYKINAALVVNAIIGISGISISIYLATGYVNAIP